MCGIAGAVGAIDPSVLDAVGRMSDAQAHRGPDQAGLWSSAGERGRGAVFGHRRLSILDLSEAGRQPMHDPASGAVIAFNGEVYNFAALREELGGLELRSSSDTEVILLAYARLGERVIERLRGMFALAIFDPREETVLFARDRVGIKPLYLSERDGVLLFASELRALLASGLVERRLDPAGLESFLWHGFVPGPGTIVEGVRLLPPGTTMKVGLDGRARAPRRYWQVPRAAPIEERSEVTVGRHLLPFAGVGMPSRSGATHVIEGERAVRELGEAVAEAVKLRLIADVPLGIFLSGGVDSSAVAALAQRASASPVTTFNIRFEESAFDEAPYARRIAEVLGTAHREVTLSEATFRAELDRALASIDQPTFDALNTYFVSRAVKEAGLTVALAGTGGDELFGGYASFVDLPRARAVAERMTLVPAKIRDRLARIATRLATGEASEVEPQTRWGKLRDVLATEGDLFALYQVSYGLFSRELLAELTLRPTGSLDWGLDPHRASELREAIAAEPDLSAISQLELASFLGERLLRDTDAASMASSLEVRVPLLDHRVIEALARVPEPLRFRPPRQKALLKQLVRAELDPRLFERPKAGFVIPLEAWCRQRLGATLDDTLHDVVLARRVGVNGEAVARLWRAFRKGGPGIYWSRVWSLFVLLSWCRAHRVYL